MAIMAGTIKKINCNVIYIVGDMSSSMCIIGRDLDVEKQFLHMIEDPRVLISKNDLGERMTEKNLSGYCLKCTELFNISWSVLEKDTCDFIKYSAYFYGNDSNLLLIRSIKEKIKKLDTSRIRMSMGILLLKKNFIVKLLNTDSITHQEKKYSLLLGELCGILGIEYLLKDDRDYFIKDLTRRTNIEKGILILNNCYMQLLFLFRLNNVRRGSV